MQFAMKNLLVLALVLSSLVALCTANILQKIQGRSGCDRGNHGIQGILGIQGIHGIHGIYGNHVNRGKQDNQGNQESCENASCGFASKCQVISGRATCVCDVQTCPAIYLPVCGSDGKTYPNECKLGVESCERQRDIHVVSQGACKSRGRINEDFHWN